MIHTIRIIDAVNTIIHALHYNYYTVYSTHIHKPVLFYNNRPCVIIIVCVLYRFNQMFGTLGILDRLHGTDELFRQTRAYERHFLLLGLLPVKEMVPDPQKKGESCCE